MPAVFLLMPVPVYRSGQSPEQHGQVHYVYYPENISGSTVQNNPFPVVFADNRKHPVLLYEGMVHSHHTASCP